MHRPYGGDSGVFCVSCKKVSVSENEVTRNSKYYFYIRKTPDSESGDQDYPF